MKWALCIAIVAFASSLRADEIILPHADAEFSGFDSEQVQLGQLLFYDPILSGNKTVSCATCHHPQFATGDGLSLGLGDGGLGLGTARKVGPENPPEQRIPRNAPPLFNLGAAEFVTLFHDGRLQADDTRLSGIRTPLDEEMEQGFASVLSAQSMFPVLSGDEMAGHYSENPVAQAVRQGFLTGKGGAWSILSTRVEEIPEYRRRFDQVIGHGTPIHFSDISNVIAAFIAVEWRADDSPFDRFLRGQAPLPPDAMRGMNLFYGAAKCSSCHAGQFQTDHGFHAIAMPQIGPGKAARFELHNRDVGRLRVTANPADAYRFRTPSLRNVVLTGPYGHAGSYSALEAAVRHHLDPVASLRSYEPSSATLPDLTGARDFEILASEAELSLIAQANELKPSLLTDTQVSDLLAFLEALTDPSSIAGRLGVPKAVPSGLPVDQ